MFCFGWKYSCVQNSGQTFFFEKPSFARNWNSVKTNFSGQSRLSDDRPPILLEQKVSKHKLDFCSNPDFQFLGENCNDFDLCPFSHPQDFYQYSSGPFCNFEFPSKVVDWISRADKQKAFPVEKHLTFRILWHLIPNSRK